MKKLLLVSLFLVAGLFMAGCDDSVNSSNDPYSITFAKTPAGKVSTSESYVYVTAIVKDREGNQMTIESGDIVWKASSADLFDTRCSVTAPDKVRISVWAIFRNKTYSLSATYKGITRTKTIEFGN